jgi:hypothetical protein
MTNKQYPSFSRKDFVLVTFGHRNAKGDLKTPPQKSTSSVKMHKSEVIFMAKLHG